MTREEIKTLKYVENQRDIAKARAAGLGVELAKARAALKPLLDDLTNARMTVNAAYAENVRLAKDVGRLQEALLVVTNENSGLKAEAVNDAHLYLLALAKLDALKNDVDSNAKLRKRLFAKSEELRLALNELGALKEKLKEPRDVGPMVERVLNTFGELETIHALAVQGYVCARKA